MKILPCLFLLLTSSLLINAQTLTGKISDKQNQPLEYVTVTLKKDSNLIGKKITDKNGNFKFLHLDTSQKYIVEFSLIGYNKKDTTIYLQNNKYIAVSLTFLENKLNEVEIKGQKKLIERKVDRLVFNVDNNVNAVGSDALDLLGMTPLVKLDNDGITIVGKGGVSLMIDEKLVHVSGEALTAYLKSIKGESISKIEVITTPPSQYDAQGNSGIINIVTKKKKEPGFFGTATSNFSRASYNTVYSGLNLSYNIDKVMLFASIFGGRGSREPSYDKSISYSSQTWVQHNVLREYTDFYRGTLGLEMEISKRTTIGFSYDGTNSKPNFSQYENTRVINKISNSIDSTLTSNNFYYKKYISNTGNLHFNHKLDTSGKELVIDGDFYSIDFSNEGNIANQNFFINGQKTPSSSAKFNSSNDQNSLGYSLNSIIKLPYKHFSLNFGSKISTTRNSDNVLLYQQAGDNLKIDSNSRNKFTYKEHIQAFFSNINKKLGRFELQAGLRAEVTETNGFSLETGEEVHTSYLDFFPTFFSTYKLNSDNIFSFSYGRRIGRPSYSSFNPFKVYSDAYSYYQGNPALKPSFTNNFELAHTFHNTFTTTLSYGRTSDIPYSVTVLNNNSRQQITIIGNFLTTSNFLIDESLDINVSKWLETSNEVSAYYNTSSAAKTLSLSKLNGYGGSFRSVNNIFFNNQKTFIGGLVFDYEFPSISAIYSYKRYYNFDLTASYLLFNKTLRISFDARDVFKTKNVSSSYVINGITNFSTANNDSRRYVINLSYSFGNTKIKRGRGYSQSGEEQGRSGH